MVKLLKYVYNEVRFKSRLSAIFLASLLWLYVALNRTFTDEIDCNVVPVNIAAGKTLSSDLPDKVTVSITGRGIDLMWLNLFWKSDLRFALDLQKVTRSGRFFIKEDQYVSSVEFPSNYDELVTINRVISPDSIYVSLDDLERKRVSVSSDSLKISLRDGYTIVGGIRFQPDSVDISGPARIVRSIQAIPTVFKSYSNRNRDFSEVVDLTMFLDSRIELNQKEARFWADVQKIGEKVINNVPISIRNQRVANIEILPSTVSVTVRGGVDYIKDIEAKDLVATIRYDSNWRRGGAYVTDLSLVLPKNIISYETSPKSFTVALK